MYKVLIVAVLLFLNGCTSCSSEKREKRMEESIQKTEKPSVPKSSTEQIAEKRDTESKEGREKKSAPEKNREQDTAKNIQEIEADAIRTIYPKIAEETQKIPECLERAETKEEAFACSDTLRQLNQDLALAIGDFMEYDVAGFGDDFLWNEETKTEMIRQIEESIKEIENTQQCLTDSEKPEKLKACLSLQL